MWYERVMGLKWLARTGWMQRGIPPAIAETVAAHTFEVAVLAHLLATELERVGAPIDVRRVLELALYHDVPEAVEGDIVKWVKDRLPHEVAEGVEREAADVAGVPEGLVNELVTLSTLEAQVVKLADNLATCLQAMRYLRQGYDMRDILEGTREYVLSAWVKKFPELSKYEKVVKEFVGRVGCGKNTT